MLYNKNSDGGDDSDGAIVTSNGINSGGATNDNIYRQQCVQHIILVKATVETWDEKCAI